MDRPFYTSAGITAGIDSTLALIEEDYGLDVALTSRPWIVANLRQDLSVETLAAKAKTATRRRNS